MMMTVTMMIMSKFPWLHVHLGGQTIMTERRAIMTKHVRLFDGSPEIINTSSF